MSDNRNKYKYIYRHKWFSPHIALILLAVSFLLLACDTDTSKSGADAFQQQKELGATDLFARSYARQIADNKSESYSFSYATQIDQGHTTLYATTYTRQIEEGVSTQVAEAYATQIDQGRSKEYAESYTRQIKLGKSETYSNSYAHQIIAGATPEYADIYANKISTGYDESYAIEYAAQIAQGKSKHYASAYSNQMSRIHKISFSHVYKNQIARGEPHGYAIKYTIHYLQQLHYKASPTYARSYAEQRGLGKNAESAHSYASLQERLQIDVSSRDPYQSILDYAIVYIVGRLNKNSVPYSENLSTHYVNLIQHGIDQDTALNLSYKFANDHNTLKDTSYLKSPYHNVALYIEAYTESRESLKSVAYSKFLAKKYVSLMQEKGVSHRTAKKRAAQYASILEDTITGNTLHHVYDRVSLHVEAYTTMVASGNSKKYAYKFAKKYATLRFEDIDHKSATTQAHQYASLEESDKKLSSALIFSSTGGE